MIDIQLLRKDPEGVAKRLATRGDGAFDAALFRALEATRKELQTAVEQAQASRNRSPRTSARPRRKGQDVARAARAGREARRRCSRAPRQQLAELQEEHPGLPRAHPEHPARVGAGRRLGRRQPRGAPLGRAAQVRLSGEGPRRRRRRRSAASISTPAPRSPAARFVVMKGERRAPAPRARAVHARRAHARARLHRGLRAVHGERASAPTASRAWPSSRTTCSRSRAATST